MELQNETIEAMKQFNGFMGNIMTFVPEDMEAYEKCYADVFHDGMNFSYMSMVFYANYSAEILLAMLTSNPFRKFLIEALDAEEKRTNGDYWNDTMRTKRFGIPNPNADRDKAELMIIANDTFTKISSLNQWFGTEDGKKEFDMYCLSRKALRDMKRIVCEYPYLIRKYDYDRGFANEIMEYAGIVANQIAQTE